jgi:hypothetical protein
MMKLTFEEVLDYLESGTEDPAFEQRIEDDPDGRRLREEAELFLELLRDHAKDEDDDGDRAYEAREMDLEAPPRQSKLSLDTTGDAFEFRRTERRVNPKAAMRTADLASRVAGLVRNLGVLEILAKGPYLEPVFHPDVPMRRKRRNLGKFPPTQASQTDERVLPISKRKMPDPQLMSFLAGGTDGVERCIRGRGIEILLPDIVDVSGPIRLEVRDTRVNVPARGLEMVFMPETGPYLRLLTNSKGIMDLPVPDGPGVLRIETTPPQMVRIELNIS